MISHNPATLLSYSTFLTSASQRKSLVMLYYQPGDIITTNITCIDLEPCRRNWKPCFRSRHEKLACQEVRHCITTSDVSQRHCRQKECSIAKDIANSLFHGARSYTTLHNTVLDFHLTGASIFRWTLDKKSHGYWTNWCIWKVVGFSPQSKLCEYQAISRLVFMETFSVQTMRVQSSYLLSVISGH